MYVTLDVPASVPELVAVIVCPMFGIEDKELNLARQSDKVAVPTTDTVYTPPETIVLVLLEDVVEDIL
jgi:hypothetical protein